VIVRISSEAQYELAGDVTDELNRLDNAAVDACQSGDETSFHEAYDKMLAFVRSRGQAVAADYLGGSDLIMPPADVSLEEARADFSGEGLLPDG
jgi:hypothetical protein